MSHLHLDEATHTYWLDGAQIPGVTSVLSVAHSFGFVSAEALESAQERGTYVHKMCELDDLGTLHPDEESGAFGGYLRAWRNFCREYGAAWDGGVECIGHSRVYRYAGTVDRRGTLKRRPGRWVIDIKTSVQKYKVWGLQTAAYRNIAAEEDARWSTAQRATVRLRNDGKYLFDEHLNPIDWPAFVSLLTLEHWDQHA